MILTWPCPQGTPQPGDVITRASVLASAWVVVAQPFAVAVAYNFAVSWNGSEDLGRSPP